MPGIMRTTGCSAILMAMHACAICLAASSQDGSAEALARVLEALRGGRPHQAYTLAEDCVKRFPREPRAYYLRGICLDELGKYAEALGDFSKCLELNPQYVAAWDHRGSVHFKLGQIQESIADFDRQIQLDPKAEAGHWRRGISYYYAGEFAKGRKQFEGYQTVDDSDVENAVWCYLCVARDKGAQQARRSLLPIRNDRRVPMMEIYALFAGQSSPQDVLAAAQAGDVSAEERNNRLFYAHLYIGLFHEAEGDAARARSHISKAAREYHSKHYMADVARVHLELLDRKKTDQTAPDQPNAEGQDKLLCHCSQTRGVRLAGP